MCMVSTVDAVSSFIIDFRVLEFLNAKDYGYFSVGVY